MRISMKRNYRLLIKIISTLVLVLLLFNINFRNDSINNKLKHQYHASNGDLDVICMILTSEKSIGLKGLAVWQTWGRHCSKIYFSCNCTNILEYQKLYKANVEIPGHLVNFKGLHDIPILQLNIVEDYKRMGEKAFLIMKLIYEQFSMAKWFLMADDDTYIFMENLNKFTSTLDTHTSELFGFRFKAMFTQGFIAGGSGILFTRESMRRLVGLITQDKCRKDMYSDISIAECALNANITIGNSHDKYNKPRFHPANPKIHFNGPIPGALLTSNSHDGTVGRNCCSVESIGFHWVEPQYMREIHRNETFLKDLFG